MLFGGKMHYSSLESAYINESVRICKEHLYMITRKTQQGF